MLRLAAFSLLALCHMPTGCWTARTFPRPPNVLVPPPPHRATDFRRGLQVSSSPTVFDVRRHFHAKTGPIRGQRIIYATQEPCYKLAIVTTIAIDRFPPLRLELADLLLLLNRPSYENFQHTMKSLTKHHSQSFNIIFRIIFFHAKKVLFFYFGFFFLRLGPAWLTDRTHGNRDRCFIETHKAN